MLPQRDPACLSKRARGGASFFIVGLPPGTRPSLAAVPAEPLLPSQTLVLLRRRGGVARVRCVRIAASRCDERRSVHITVVVVAALETRRPADLARGSRARFRSLCRRSPAFCAPRGGECFVLLPACCCWVSREDVFLWHKTAVGTLDGGARGFLPPALFYRGVLLIREARSFVI